jgi:hypothetical protein
MTLIKKTIIDSGYNEKKVVDYAISADDWALLTLFKCKAGSTIRVIANDGTSELFVKQSDTIHTKDQFIADSAILTDKEDKNLKNQANGYAGLDANSLLLLAQLQAIINDASSADTDKTWSNSKINTAINTAIANLVASSPATLDTLNELATALGNDPNFATTIATQVGLKINTSDIVDALTSTLSNVPLSAKQGKVLNDLITALTTTVGNKVNVSDIVDALTSTLTNVPLSAKQGKVLNDLITALTTTVGNKVNVSDIVDALTSTATNVPLSAKQGKVLNDLITALTTTVGNKVNVSDIVDALTSTLTNVPLSAKQGSVLQAQILALRKRYYKGNSGATTLANGTNAGGVGSSALSVSNVWSLPIETFGRIVTQVGFGIGTGTFTNPTKFTLGLYEYDPVTMTGAVVAVTAEVTMTVTGAFLANLTSSYQTKIDKLYTTLATFNNPVSLTSITANTFNPYNWGSRNNTVLSILGMGWFKTGYTYTPGSITAAPLPEGSDSVIGASIWTQYSII